MSLTISIAQELDAESIYQLTAALADYEHEESLLTLEKVRKYGFGKNKMFEAVIAHFNGKPVGMAVFFFAWASYSGAPILYGEDLFVLPEYRGRGIGKKIIQKLECIANERECCEMRWVVYDWNEKAIGFYNKLGATVRKDIIAVHYKMRQLETKV